MAKRRSSNDNSTSLEDIRVKHSLPYLAAGKSTKTSLAFHVAAPPNNTAPTSKPHPPQFLLGSLTKAMTATLVAILVNDGLLRWDATLQDLLSTSLNLHPSVRAIKLGDLTAHRSGLTQPYGLRPLWAYGFWDSSLSPEDGRALAVQDVLSKPAKFRIGTHYYENINYIIVGYIIDRLGHGTYEHVITERLFKPLGMSESGFGPLGQSSLDSPDIPAPHIPNLLPWPATLPLSWLPYRFHSLPPAMNPAGCVRCSLRDYDRFLRLHADGGGGDGRLGLTEENFRFLHTPYAEDDGGSRFTFGGWIRPREDDHGSRQYSLCHSGANLFYNSHARVDVGEGRGDCYVAATNVAVGQGACVEAVEAMRLGKLSL